jgi:hypothetical protein
LQEDRRIDGSDEEIVEVINFGFTGLKPILRTGLVHDYFIGDIFHHVDTVPNSVLISPFNPLVEIPGSQMRLDMTFRTSRNLTVF